MNFHQIQHFLNVMLTPFESSSLINDDGKLIASCDENILQSSTSRLVVCQIIRKYLNPQIGDLFIVNDPENGGLNYQNIFFVSRLTDKLYLVFVQETNHINFKIPPTPLYEKSARNKTIWPFLVEQNPQAQALANFFDSKWLQVSQLQAFKSFFQMIAMPKNLQVYFKNIERIFDRQFSNRALGQNEITYKLNGNDTIKLKLAIDEKQNQRTIYADFSQSSSAQKISVASHIVESCLVKALADHYGMTEILSQPLLDRIRLTLPPQSIVSKANSLGSYNLLIQKIVSEQAGFLLSTLAGQLKGKATVFKLSPESRMILKIADKNYSIHASSKKFVFSQLDYLIQTHQVMPLIVQNFEGKLKIKFQIKTAAPVSLVPMMLNKECPADFLSVGGVPVTFDSELKIPQNEFIEINWKLNDLRS